MDKLNKVNVIHFIHFHAHFLSREGRTSTSPRRTQNTSRSTAISHSSAGSTPRRDQARSEVQTLHLGFGRLLGCFPLDLASRNCLTSLLWTFWTHGQTNVVVISEFGEVVQHSGVCEFHNCTFCCKVSHQGSNEGAQCPERRFTERRRKVPTMSQVFLQYSIFTY